MLVCLGETYTKRAYIISLLANEQVRYPENIRLGTRVHGEDSDLQSQLCIYIQAYWIWYIRMHISIRYTQTSETLEPLEGHRLL